MPRPTKVSPEDRRSHPCAIEGSRGPTRPADIADALTATDKEEAGTVITYLSAGGLVFPGQLRRDRGHAHRAAQRVVKLLGWDSTWWRNIELSDAGHGRNPVSRFSFDGVVAGTGNEFVVALLQVGEDRRVARHGSEHRFRGSIRARFGCGRRLMGRPDRVAGIRPRPASLMSAVAVRSLLIRSSVGIGQWRP